MAKRPKPKAERRTWDQLSDAEDVLGTDEADGELPVEFLRKRRPKKEGERGKEPPTKPR